MKRRILYLLMGLALIASLSLGALASPREASALPTSYPDACEVIGLHFKHYYGIGDSEMVYLLVAAAYDLGCL